MKSRRQLFRYLVVGVATNAAGFIAYVLLTALGANPFVAISILYVVQIGLAFYLNKNWSFGAKGHSTASAIKYLTAYVACYALNVAALKVFAGDLGLSYLAVQAAAVPVCAALLFVAQKYWVFRSPGTPVSVKRAS